MSRTSLWGHRRRNYMQSLLIAAVALTGIGTVQAQSGAPGQISTVYNGDVINGKKIFIGLGKSMNLKNGVSCHFYHLVILPDKYMKHGFFCMKSVFCFVPDH